MFWEASLKNHYSINYSCFLKNDSRTQIQNNLYFLKIFKKRTFKLFNIKSAYFLIFNKKQTGLNHIYYMYFKKVWKYHWSGWESLSATHQIDFFVHKITYTSVLSFANLKTWKQGKWKTKTKKRATLFIVPTSCLMMPIHYSCNLVGPTKPFERAKWRLLAFIYFDFLSRKWSSKIGTTAPNRSFS